MPIIDGDPHDWYQSRLSTKRRIAELEEQVASVAHCPSGHQYMRAEFSGCPICAMKAGVSGRISHLERERDAWIAANEEAARVHLIEKNALREAVRVLAEALRGITEAAGDGRECPEWLAERLAHPAVKEALR